MLAPQGYLVDCHCMPTEQRLVRLADSVELGKASTPAVATSLRPD